MDSLKDFSRKVEDVLDQAATPVKPYVAPIARFLLVVTFLEDTFRIISQWEDQVYYLETFQNMSRWFTYFFLLFNIVFMLIGSALAIIKK
jgi:hypothetical protein